MLLVLVALEGIVVLKCVARTQNQNAPIYMMRISTSTVLRVGSHDVDIVVRLSQQGDHARFVHIIYECFEALG